MRLGITVRSEADYYFVKKQYLKFLSEFEIIFLYPYINTHAHEECDGFVVIGGTDINPKYYGEENYASYLVEEEIDELDLKVIDYAVNNNMPLLGICRGLQVINVYFNGTLKQHVLNHSEGVHRIVLVENYLDFPPICETNTFHHQSVKKLGDELKVLYYSLDGEVELLIHKKYPIIATQFHPEKDIENELSLKVLDYFKNLLKIYNK